MSGVPFGVLLDLDGTLTDSEQGIIRCMRHALQQMRRPVPDDAALRRLIGPPTQQTFATLLGSEERALVDEAVRLYRERFAATGIFENRLYPGITEMLDALQALGCRMVLATSKPHIYAQRIVEHFGLDRWLSAVYGAELDGTRADKAELLRHLLERERFDPVLCLMAGDRRHDVLGARANGVEACSVRWGYGEAAELAAAAPDFYCDTPAELVALVRTRIAAAARR
ncbi:HAD hydrolase-like protein [Solimonas soli]|uniref:HAD hydrolase-like protein n=1 Tax=Solimonas soli TaxID=413479 RepID=UPI00048308B9|nr:HAD hydrolase-like protein [Solimonas soli]